MDIWTSRPNILSKVLWTMDIITHPPKGVGMSVVQTGFYFLVYPTKRDNSESQQKLG